MSIPQATVEPPEDPQEGLSKIIRICEAFHISTLQPQLRACQELSRNRGMVDIAVLGQFKAGKSSFLNSLMGEAVLPVDVLPATAVVTRLGYGDKNGVLVRLLSGECQESTLEELASFVTERENPGNMKQVEAVEVRLPALAPFHGVRFVDTPGLGSVHAHNTQASLDWLPKVGGALLAIGVNQPFGEQDLKLLLEVAKHTPEVVILLTKADLVSAGQLESILAFTQHQAAQHIGRQLLVLPYSTHPDFEPMRLEVRNLVLRDMAGRHEDLYTNILNHKYRALIAACREYLLLAQRAALAAEASRSVLRDILRHEQASLQSVKSETGVFIRDLQARAKSDSAAHFQMFRGEVTRHLQDSLRKEMAGWEGHLAKRSERFQRWLVRAMTEEMTRVSGHGQPLLENQLVDAQTSLQRKVRGFQDRLAKAIEQALGLTFEGPRFHAEVSEPRHPDVRIGKIFDTQVDLLWFLIPMGIFGPLFERHYLGLLPWEAEKNLSRLSYQWAEAANACIDDLVAQAMTFMRQELATLESLTDHADDRRLEIQDALAALDDLSMSGEPRVPDGRSSPPMAGQS
jgi:GTP-binding protein EngB required for normal cell division